MRISFVTIEETKVSPSGTRAVQVALQKALEDRGHVVDVFSYRETQTGPLALVPPQAIATAYAEHMRQAWAKDRPDVVHICLPGRVGSSALFAAKSLGILVTAAFHHVHIYAAPNDRARVLQTAMSFYKHCDVVIAEHEGSLPVLNEHAVPCTVIYGGVNTNNFDPLRRSDSLRASWGVSENAVVLLFVGRLIPTKDPQGFAAVCNYAKSLHPSVRAVVVGDGPEMESLKASLPLATFTGQLTDEALYRAYASSDILVMPSPEEPWGNVALEAAASGLAVAGISGGVIHEILAPRQACSMPVPKDRDELAKAVVRLIAEPAQRKEIAKRAREVAQGMSWYATASEHDALWHACSIARPNKETT